MDFIDSAGLQLPDMYLVRQLFSAPPALDVAAEIDRQWPRIQKSISIAKGKAIAIGVGSRGIANLATVVRTVAAKLREAGYAPFITPAMGSHGGATAQGQIDVLAARGITAQSVGAPVRATMEVVSMGEVDGIPIFQDKLAHAAAGMVLINRVKPHTDFTGPTESGIIKMMAIGLGNQIGAEHYHRLSVERNMYEVISTAGAALTAKSNLLFGVALVENQAHQTAVMKMVLPSELKAVESKLLKQADAFLPRLPLETIDLLIIDEMGKDVSGAGIDPVVTGRYSCANMTPKPGPQISRIFVRELTPATEGCALGIGQADVTTRRLVDGIDFESTAVNALTSCGPEDVRVPLAFDSDRDALAAVLMTIRPHTLDDLRIVHIKNTLELGRLMVSQGCLDQLAGNPVLKIAATPASMAFDGRGYLQSPIKS